MELRHLTMVNWHLFDAEDIALGGHVGILGENRSGKSTILDMIQVVLTGASRSYLRLNAVAGESGRSRSGCQTAWNVDPGSASKIDPLDGCVVTPLVSPAERVGVAQPG